MFFLGVILDFKTIITFLAGIITGVLLLFLIYLALILIGINKEKKIIKAQSILTSEEMVARIENTKLAFKQQNLKGIKSVSYTYDLCKKLVYDTASDFFPDSKYPLFELSVDEILMLLDYITNRIDNLLSYKGINFIRKVKVSTIVNFSGTKTKVEQNPVYKKLKRYKLYSTWQAASKVINLVNPLWWGRKIFVNGAINIIINKICLISIGIVGEEVYKIYSKKVFDKDVLIDSGIESDLDDIKKIEELEEGDYEYEKEEFSDQ